MFGKNKKAKEKQFNEQSDENFKKWKEKWDEVGVICAQRLFEKEHKLTQELIDHMRVIRIPYEDVRMFLKAKTLYDALEFCWLPILEAPQQNFASNLISEQMEGWFAQDQYGKISYHTIIGADVSYDGLNIRSSQMVDDCAYSHGARKIYVRTPKAYKTFTGKVITEEVKSVFNNVDGSQMLHVAEENLNKTTIVAEIPLLDGPNVDLIMDVKMKWEELSKSLKVGKLFDFNKSRNRDENIIKAARILNLAPDEIRELDAAEALLN